MASVRQPKSKCLHVKTRTRPRRTRQVSTWSAAWSAAWFGQRAAGCQISEALQQLRYRTQSTSHRYHGLRQLVTYRVPLSLGSSCTLLPVTRDSQAQQPRLRLQCADNSLVAYRHHTDSLKPCHPHREAGRTRVRGPSVFQPISTCGSTPKHSSFALDSGPSAAGGPMAARSHRGPVARCSEPGPRGARRARARPWAAAALMLLALAGRFAGSAAQGAARRVARARSCAGRAAPLIPSHTCCRTAAAAGRLTDLAA